MKRDDNNRKESQVDEDNNYREGKVDLQKKTFLKFYLKADCCKKNSVDSSQSQALKWRLMRKQEIAQICLHLFWAHQK